MGFAFTVAPVFLPISNEFYIKEDMCQQFSNKVARLICSKVKGKLIFTKFMNRKNKPEIKKFSLLYNLQICLRIGVVCPSPCVLIHVHTNTNLRRVL